MSPANYNSGPLIQQTTHCVNRSIDTGLDCLGCASYGFAAGNGGKQMSTEYLSVSKTTVIANQPAGWCGDPPKS